MNQIANLLPSLVFAVKTDLTLHNFLSVLNATLPHTIACHRPMGLLTLRASVACIEHTNLYYATKPLLQHVLLVRF